MGPRNGSFFLLATALLLAAPQPAARAEEPCKNHFILRCPEPAAAEWTAEKLVFMRHPGVSATKLDDGRVLVAGGGVGSTEIYDPATGESAPAASMGQARSNHQAVRLLDGRVLVVGGDGYSSTAEIFDPATGTWSFTPPMVYQRIAFRP